jgi:prepilin-type N-terminal cleavage/methylation domain-containing protein
MKSIHKKAFTLVELLVVISIIGVLSSTVFATLSSAKGKARDARRMQDIVQISKALSAYASANNGVFPSGNYFTRNAINTDVNFAANWWSVLQGYLSGYFSPLPVDPISTTWNDTRWYFYSGNFTSGMISAANGHEGTCAGKAVIMALHLEVTTNPRQDCVFDAFLQSVFPKAVIIVPTI